MEEAIELHEWFFTMERPPRDTSQWNVLAWGRHHASTSSLKAPLRPHRMLDHISLRSLRRDDGAKVVLVGPMDSDRAIAAGVPLPIRLSFKEGIPSWTSLRAKATAYYPAITVASALPPGASRSGSPAPVQPGPLLPLISDDESLPVTLFDLGTGYKRPHDSPRTVKQLVKVLQNMDTSEEEVQASPSVRGDRDANYDEEEEEDEEMDEQSEAERLCRRFNGARTAPTETQLSLNSHRPGPIPPPSTAAAAAPTLVTTAPSPSLPSFPTPPATEFAYAVVAPLAILQMQNEASPAPRVPFVTTVTPASAKSPQNPDVTSTQSRTKASKTVSKKPRPFIDTVTTSGSATNPCSSPLQVAPRPRTPSPPPATTAPIIQNNVQDERGDRSLSPMYQCSNKEPVAVVPVGQPVTAARARCTGPNAARSTTGVDATSEAEVDDALLGERKANGVEDDSSAKPQETASQPPFGPASILAAVSSKQPATEKGSAQAARTDKQPEQEEDQLASTDDDFPARSNGAQSTAMATAAEVARIGSPAPSPPISLTFIAPRPPRSTTNTPPPPNCSSTKAGKDNGIAPGKKMNKIELKRRERAALLAACGEDLSKHPYGTARDGTPRMKRGAKRTQAQIEAVKAVRRAVALEDPAENLEPKSGVDGATSGGSSGSQKETGKAKSAIKSKGEGVAWGCGLIASEPSSAPKSRKSHSTFVSADADEDEEAVTSASRLPASPPTPARDATAAPSAPDPAPIVASCAIALTSDGPPVASTSATPLDPPIVAASSRCTTAAASTSPPRNLCPAVSEQRKNLLSSLSPAPTSLLAAMPFADATPPIEVAVESRQKLASLRTPSANVDPSAVKRIDSFARFSSVQLAPALAPLVDPELVQTLNFAVERVPAPSPADKRAPTPAAEPVLENRLGLTQAPALTPAERPASISFAAKRKKYPTVEVIVKRKASTIPGHRSILPTGASAQSKSKRRLEVDSVEEDEREPSKAAKSEVNKAEAEADAAWRKRRKKKRKERRRLEQLARETEGEGDEYGVDKRDKVKKRKTKQNSPTSSPEPTEGTALASDQTDSAEGDQEPVAVVKKPSGRKHPKVKKVLVVADDAERPALVKKKRGRPSKAIVAPAVADQDDDKVNASDPSAVAGKSKKCASFQASRASQPPASAEESDTAPADVEKRKTTARRISHVAFASNDDYKTFDEEKEARSTRKEKRARDASSSQEEGEEEEEEEEIRSSKRQKQDKRKSRGSSSGKAKVNKIARKNVSEDEDDDEEEEDDCSRCRPRQSSSLRRAKSRRQSRAPSSDIEPILLAARAAPSSRFRPLQPVRRKSGYVSTSRRGSRAPSLSPSADSTSNDDDNHARSLKGQTVILGEAEWRDVRKKLDLLASMLEAATRGRSVEPRDRNVKSRGRSVESRGRTVEPRGRSHTRQRKGPPGRKHALSDEEEESAREDEEEVEQRSVIKVRKVLKKPASNLRNTPRPSTSSSKPTKHPPRVHKSKPIGGRSTSVIPSSKANSSKTAREPSVPRPTVEVNSDSDSSCGNSSGSESEYGRRRGVSAMARSR